jgi:hypothetical protein
MKFLNRFLLLALGLLSVAGASVAAAGAAAAQGTRNLPCNQDYIGVADSSGNVIRLRSGQLFEVFPGQNRKVIFWQPLDKVTVCAIGGAASRITNLDPRKGGSVEAIRQF